METEVIQSTEIHGSPCFVRLTWYVMLMLWNKYFLEFVLTILYTYVSVWNHKETSQLATALAGYYTKLRSKLVDVNFLISRTLYCNLVSLETCSAKVDEILQERQIQYGADRYVLLVHYLTSSLYLKYLNFFMEYKQQLALKRAHD